MSALRWLRKTWFYRAWSRFLTWFGDVRVDFDLPEVKGEDITRLLLEAQSGDIILRKYDCYADSLFIPGEYTHSGICVGDGLVLHMIADGKVLDSLIDFVKDCDGFLLLRPEYEEGGAATAVAWAKSVEAQYDFFFTPDEFADLVDDVGREVAEMYLYCSEYTAIAMVQGGIRFDSGKMFILPVDMIEHSETIMEV